MTDKTLTVRSLTRFPQESTEDELVFEPGVNVIVGPPNTGKTKWLRMLDCLLGSETKPEDLLGDDVAAKYESCRAVLAIAGEEFTIERKWNQAHLKTKVFLDGEPLNPREFDYRLMAKLGIPIVHYPQGDPYGVRAWPELNWRSLFRQIYRRQAFWSDLADRQFPSEQHATLMQFLGIAETLFSTEYGDLVSKEKQIQELEMRKEQWVSMLQQVSREMMDEKEVGVALTPQSINDAMQRISAEVEILQQRRSSDLSALLKSAIEVQKNDENIEPNQDAVAQLGEDLSRLHIKLQSDIETLKRTEARLTEVREYRESLSNELARLERARKGGSSLADLRITHCPACDRAIKADSSSKGECFLCHRPILADTNASKRLDFEYEQLQGELKEIDELISLLSEEIKQRSAETRTISGQIQLTEGLLRPIRTAAAAIIPPEIGIGDIQTGRLQERLQQLTRLKNTLEYRTTLSEQIVKVQEQAALLQAEVLEKSKQIDFERASDLLEDGMNTYLNLIKESNPRSWTQQSVNVLLSDRSFKMTVGHSNWYSKLGGTLTLYFLISYHYALMSLTTHENCHYPGLLILDFPAELEDGSSVADKENFVLEPFIALMSKSGMETSQVIAAGSSFEKLAGANRTELNHIWH